MASNNAPAQATGTGPPEAGETATSPEYVPVDLRTLRLDSTLSFNLYIRFGTDYVLYRHADRAFDKHTLTSLLDNRVDTLFVDGESQRRLARYFELHLPLILTDQRVPVTERASSVLQVAENLARDVLTTPDGGGARRAVRMVEELVTFASDAPNALARLIQALGDGSTLEQHSANTAVLALALSSAHRDISMDMLGDVSTAALFHDVGLSVVGPHILQKPGPLDDAERELVQQHPITGEQMLRQVGGFSDVVLAAVRGHHERLDGSGYPDGLRGRKISPIARVIGIAEAFDALTSVQPYRDRFKPAEALRLMLGDMAGQFDEALMRQFIPALIGRVEPGAA